MQSPEALSTSMLNTLNKTPFLLDLFDLDDQCKVPNDDYNL